MMNLYAACSAALNKGCVAMVKKNGGIGLYIIRTVVCAAVIASVIMLAVCIRSADTVSADTPAVLDLAAEFNSAANNVTSSALDGIYYVKKVYKIPESAVVSPRPDPEAYGYTRSPAEIDRVIADASELLGDDKLIWDGGAGRIKSEQMSYYLDDTIMVILWKEVIGNSVYNFAEIKIAHGSQLRRMFTDNAFGSNKRWRGSTLAKNANAVIAMNGDYYGYRSRGIVVYQRTLYRSTAKGIDNCFVDENGKMILTEADKFANEAELQQFIADNNILFSLSFGPILVKDGIARTSAACESYPLGEPDLTRARAAIAQIDDLHYLMCTVDGAQSGGFYRGAYLDEFARALAAKGCPDAYTLDGGQTALMVFDNQVVNYVVTGSERTVTDIVYFASAQPE